MVIRSLLMKEAMDTPDYLNHWTNLALSITHTHSHLYIYIYIERERVGYEDRLKDYMPYSETRA